MRRIAIVLVLLLSASAARAGISTQDLIFSPLICCSALLFIFSFAFILSLVLYDLRKARRQPPPTKDE